MNSLKKIRIDYLDSIRGLAALAVVIYHFIGWRGEFNTAKGVSFMLFNGSEAVSLFFILSGFVLSLPILNQLNENVHYSGKGFVAYIFKRICRIYPAYWCMLFVYYVSVQNWSLDSNFFTGILHNSKEIWQESILVRNQHEYFIPGWTLEVEIALSILLPLLVIVAKYNLKILIVFMTASVFLGTHFISMFTLHFGLGIIIAFNYPKLQSSDFRQTGWYKKKAHHFTTRFYIVFITPY